MQHPKILLQFDLSILFCSIKIIKLFSRGFLFHFPAPTPRNTLQTSTPVYTFQFISFSLHPTMSSPPKTSSRASIPSQIDQPYHIINTLRETLSTYIPIDCVKHFLLKACGTVKSQDIPIPLFCTPSLLVWIKIYSLIATPNCRIFSKQIICPLSFFFPFSYDMSSKT